MAHAFHVRAVWDDEARVWYVAESDVPGLCAEAGTVEELHDKVLDRVPELVETNRHLLDSPPARASRYTSSPRSIL